MPTFEECVAAAGRALAEEVHEFNASSAGVNTSPGGVQSLSRD